MLTVINELQRTALRKHYQGKKYKPLDLRAKKTRAIRRRLTPYALRRHHAGIARGARREQRDACTLHGHAPD